MLCGSIVVRTLVDITKYTGLRNKQQSASVAAEAGSSSYD